MDKSLYDEHGDLEEEHWWFRGRRAIIRAFVEQIPQYPFRALDIGCGTGRNALLLRDYAKEVQGTEDSEDAIRLAKAKHPWLSVIRASLPSIPLEGSFDLITMFDVLEHVEDDRGALAAIHEKLNPGAYLLLTVPAYSFLWSEHDEMAYHKRRYIKDSLVKKVREAGFSSVRVSYFNMFLFPIVFLVRTVKRGFGIQSGSSDFSMMPRPLNALLAAIFSSESLLTRIVSLPFGVSLICLAKKS